MAYRPQRPIPPPRSKSLGFSKDSAARLYIISGLALYSHEATFLFGRDSREGKKRYGKKHTPRPFLIIIPIPQHPHLNLNIHSPFPTHHLLSTTIPPIPNLQLPLPINLNPEPLKIIIPTSNIEQISRRVRDVLKVKSVPARDGRFVHFGRRGEECAGGRREEAEVGGEGDG